ncbi:hypothetical protein [Pedobacter sp. V48]|uniref:hypothetical protein n=1 Tax=Pedobacter sp. V48 TaxID=509635 RepID=UPI0003E46F9B|nr:hypothetical protein [Pedobacter sp. V48]ETZ22800.1 hypothetical protein N824_21150 [Pedobacter sp. V48]
MGQRIAAIITKGQVDVPESVVHFAQHNLTIIGVSDDEGGYRKEKWLFLVELIESLELKCWFIEFYSEWGDRPSNHLFMPIIDNNIIKESCIHMWNEDGVDYTLISSTKLRMGLTLNWFANENRYFTYEHAKRGYELRKL